MELITIGMGGSWPTCLVHLQEDGGQMTTALLWCLASAVHTRQQVLFWRFQRICEATPILHA